MKRRQFVAGASAATAVAVAGCSSILGGGSGGPEGVVEDAYDAVNDQDADAFESLLHSESPERPVEEDQFSSDGEGSFEINLQSTEVTNDEPSEDDIRSEYSDRSQEDIDTMAGIVGDADDAALVEAEAEFTFELNGEEQTETQTAVHFTATEDGDWTLVT